MVPSDGETIDYFWRYDFFLVEKKIFFFFKRAFLGVKNAKKKFFFFLKPSLKNAPYDDHIRGAAFEGPL